MSVKKKHPVFLRKFGPFIQESGIVDLAHNVHLLSMAILTVSSSFGEWVACSNISNVSVGSVSSCMSHIMWCDR